MDLRRVTGYLALGVLALYWLWVLTRTAPVLRHGCRDRRLRVRLALVRTAAAGGTALFVATVHFWATSWWHVAAALPVALTGAAGLVRVHRRLVAPPRHRVALAQRVRRAGHFQVIDHPGPGGPHRHAAVEDAARPVRGFRAVRDLAPAPGQPAAPTGSRSSGSSSSETSESSAAGVSPTSSP
ncbi:hypothetical protein [Pseudonocardia sp. ICBG1293]|uniref:hypothetical protein n=1 Tax=Pseudonocardia sp. ICBG1293 TaxID=2844382 RepID=UPI001CCCA4CE|nr:hypothetical protein [Pseudonocardia sp. ICBG1293]